MVLVTPRNRRFGPRYVNHVSDRSREWASTRAVSLPSRPWVTSHQTPPTQRIMRLRFNSGLATNQPPPSRSSSQVFSLLPSAQTSPSITFLHTQVMFNSSAKSWCDDTHANQTSLPHIERQIFVGTLITAIFHGQYHDHTPIYSHSPCPFDPSF